MRHPFLALTLVASLGAQAPAPAADPFACVRFLVGEWKGEGDGRPEAFATYVEATMHKMK